MSALSDFFAIQERNRRGTKTGGRASVALCTAHPLAIEAGLQFGKLHGLCVNIQSTCAQVNHRAGETPEGGYTGMKPANFVDFVKKLAQKHGLSFERVLLALDHGGPTPWKGHPAKVAMEEGCRLIHDSVLAGYQLLHLDPSPKCADDDANQPEDQWLEEVARRTVQLAHAAEAARAKNGLQTFYVFGADVPPPGGMTATAHAPKITTPEQLAHTIEVHRKAFVAGGLQKVWDEQMISIVVDHGADFGHSHVAYFDSELATPLTQAFQGQRIRAEAHSTDYQLLKQLAEMVDGGFGTLKVGPELTYEVRKAIFDLLQLEAELIADPSRRSGLREVLEAVMMENPGYWKKYYPGDAAEQHLLRRCSRLDRIRYYWANPTVAAAVEVLFNNLRGVECHTALFSEVFGDLPYLLSDARVVLDPEQIVRDRVQIRVIKKYSRAAGLIS